jgi:hypothetical protein
MRGWKAPITSARSSCRFVKDVFSSCHRTVMWRRYLLVRAAPRPTRYGRFVARHLRFPGRDDMKDVDTTKMSADDWDELNFPRPEVQDFDRVVERAISRRGFLGGVLAFGSGAAVMGTAFLKGSTAMAQGASRFPFEAIAAQTDNTIHVPEGYSWDVLVRWGDPLFSDAEGASIRPPACPSRCPTACSARTPTAWSCSISTAARSSWSTANTRTATSTCPTPRTAPDARRRAHPAELPGRVRDGDRRGRGWLVGRGRQPLQPPHHPPDADEFRWPRRRARPAQDRGRSDRHEHRSARSTTAAPAARPGAPT